MSKLPALKPKVILRALLRAGFFIHHQHGSHIQIRHATKLHIRVTIPYHARFDIPSDVLASIIKQMELSRDEFLNLL